MRLTDAVRVLQPHMHLGGAWGTLQIEYPEWSAGQHVLRGPDVRRADGLPCWPHDATWQALDALGGWSIPEVDWKLCPARPLLPATKGGRVIDARFEALLLAGGAFFTHDPTREHEQVTDLYRWVVWLDQEVGADALVGDVLATAVRVFFGAGTDPRWLKTLTCYKAQAASVVEATIAPAPRPAPAPASRRLSGPTVPRPRLPKPAAEVLQSDLSGDFLRVLSIFPTHTWTGARGLRRGHLRVVDGCLTLPDLAEGVPVQRTQGVATSSDPIVVDAALRLRGHFQSDDDEITPHGWRDANPIRTLGYMIEDATRRGWIS